MSRGNPKSILAESLSGRTGLGGGQINSGNSVGAKLPEKGRLVLENPRRNNAKTKLVASGHVGGNSGLREHQRSAESPSSSIGVFPSFSRRSIRLS